MEDFSAVLIARNEVAVLPRLLKSLEGVQDIVVLDTGSTDNTAAVAEAAGCTVIQVGSMFLETPTEEDIQLFKQRYGFQPTFTTESKLFNYAAARNYAMQHAKNDWCFQPDCDEIVEWNLAEVRKLLPTTDQLDYRFCFAHNADGSPALEFNHTKFFRKSKLKWVKKVHEIHAPLNGDGARMTYTEHIYLHHWQQQSDNRGNYLPKLEYAILENENDDRNTYYLGREYYYNGMWEKAIKVLTRAIEIGWWKPELGQAYMEMAACYEALGNLEKAEECLYNSIKMNDRRREPFKALGDFFQRQNQLERAITYYEAAMSVPFSVQGYLNQMELYGWLITDALTVLYDRIGKKDIAMGWWMESMKHCPPEVIVKNGLKYFFDELPLISIVVPTCRPDGYARLEKSIKEKTIYPKYEIIKKDNDDQTAIQKFNQGVREANGDFIVYIADDCEVTHCWLENAFICLVDKFRDRGLVVLNDNYWDGTLANHFLCTKNLRENLDGTIWSEEYFHSAVDNELFCRLSALRLIEFCESAKIIHYHMSAQTKGAEASPMDEYYQKIIDHYPSDRMTLVKRLYALGFTKEAKAYKEMFFVPVADKMEHFYESIGTKLMDMFTFQDLYTQAVRSCRDGGTIVEVGSWIGRSAAYLAVEVVNSGKNIKIVCVDAFSGNVQTADKTEMYPQYAIFKSSLEPVWDRITVIKSLSHLAADQFEDNSIDFVMIDACHETENVRQDINAWWPKVRVGGAIAGHDGHYVEVLTAVREFALNNELECSFVKGDCWLIVKEEMPCLFYGMNFNKYLNKIRDNEHFKYARYNDGEFNAIRKEQGGNCDGHQYFASMGEELKAVLLQYKKRDDYVLELFKYWYDGIPQLREFVNGLKAINPELSFMETDWIRISHEQKPEDFLLLLDELKKKNLVIVGPEYLSALHKFFDFGHIVVPLRDCYLEKDRIIEQIKMLNGANSNHVYLFSASMATNVIIDEFKHDEYNTYIDWGSVWDTFFVGPEYSFINKRETSRPAKYLEIYKDYLINGEGEGK